MKKLQFSSFGILGGSFDPPHYGHLKISKLALKKLPIKRLLWIVNKKNPFKLIEPNLRWFPGSDMLGDKGREKLLPPLVNKIRKEVSEWRSKGYPDISVTTKILLNYWFNTDHKNGFEYYFAQILSVT